MLAAVNVIMFFDFLICTVGGGHFNLLNGEQVF